MTQDRSPLPGSERHAVAGSKRIGDADASQQVEVTLTLRGPDLPPVPGEVPLTPDEFATRYGATQADADAVRQALGAYGIEVTAVSLASRTMSVRGTVSALEEAFGVSLGIYQTAAQGSFRGRAGSLSVPASLAGIVTGVFGLDERQVARRKDASFRATASAAGKHRLGAQTPADLESRYAFPAGDGSGQHIAIAEFGGAYFAEDLTAFCAKNHRPVPTVKPVSAGYPVLTLQQVRALPADEQSQVLDMSVEVMMDVEIIAALCPAAAVTVLFAPFTQKGWIDLLDKTMAQRPLPVALSISWGLPEDSPDWSSAALQEINQRLQAAAMLGVTVCAASGDDGASARMHDGKAHVNFPSSSPFVLAVGGTELTSAGKEVVWWDAPGERTPHGGGATSSGVSQVFPRPPWQDVHIKPINHPSLDGRVVPDVAALAGSPDYDLIFLGRDMPNGGTSASAPLWASLIARIAEGLPQAKQRRFLSPLLYAAGPDGAAVGSTGCRDIVSGNTHTPTVPHGFPATAGYDAATGWGTPVGTTLAGLLR